MKSLLDGVTRRGLGHTPIQNPAQHSGYKFQNKIKWELVGPDGVPKAKGEKEGNIMATYGLDRAVKMFGTDAGGASAFANYMAIGTHTLAESSTHNRLSASTQQVTLSRSAAGNLTIEYQATFASDGNASSINEIGVFQTNQATASMIARSVLGTASINRGASDEIRASYQIIATTA